VKKLARLVLAWRFYFKGGGPQVKIPYDLMPNLFLVAEPYIRINSMGTVLHTGKYRLGIGVYGDLNPELKEWLSERGPYKVEPFQYSRDVAAVATALIEHLEHGISAHAIRFAYEEDAALFKITWL
jgi:hypothetical protein